MLQFCSSACFFFFRYSQFLFISSFFPPPLICSVQGEHLVCVGGYIYLWNWRSGMLVTKIKASSSCSAVTSVSFSADAEFVITAGKKHLKIWTIGSSPGTRLNKGTLSLTMHGKPVNLGPQKGSSFTSVTSTILTSRCVVNNKQAGDLFAIYALTDEGWISPTISMRSNAMEFLKKSSVTKSPFPFCFFYLQVFYALWIMGCLLEIQWN